MPASAWSTIMPLCHRRALLVLTGSLLALAAVHIGSRASPAADLSGPADLPFTLPPGFVAELVVGPPLVEHPMFACFDDRGRLFVADSRGVNPKGEQLGTKPAQVIRLLESTGADGCFDRSTVFADQLTYPEGIAWHDGAVFTAAPPSLWRLEDTRGTGAADRRVELVTGYVHTGIADDLHGPTLGPDGRLYWGCGRFQHSIRKPGGEVLWKGRAPLVQRCKPDGSAVEVVCGAQGNPVKFAFTPEGEPFACGTWATRVESMGKDGRVREDLIIHCLAGGNYPMLDGDFYAPEFKHTPGYLPPLVYLGTAAACGLARYEDGPFGLDYEGNLFSALYNMHKVVRHIIERDGATFRSRNQDFLVSDRPAFHPTDVIEDADGSLLVVDTGSWFDHCPTSKLGKEPVPGGIYRIRKRGAAPPADPRGLKLAWDRLPAVKLTGLLDDPRWAVRDRAVRELAKQGEAALPVLRDAVASGKTVRLRRNAVWALNRIESGAARAAVRAALADKEESVRLTAANVAGLQRDADAGSRLLALLKSDTPPVRREAATALGRLGKVDAVPVLFDALRTGGDRYLEHALIYALIEIGNRGATLEGLSDPSPLVRRAAVIALDQMDGGNLTREQVAPLLDTEDVVLQQTVLAIIAGRPGWAGQSVGLLRQWLAEKDLPAERSESLRGTLLAFAGETAVQKLVAETLQQDQTPVATRLLLLEAVARVPQGKLPASWAGELGRALEHPDERVARQAVAAVRAAGVTTFDDRLVHLAKDRDRPADVRAAALAAAAPRLTALEPLLFDFLVGRLDREMPSLARLEAAGALGNARLHDAQLEALTGAVAQAGALEMPHLVAAFGHGTNPEVGRKLVTALGKSPGLESLSEDVLRRTLEAYPNEIRREAQPLFKRLEVDAEKQKARLDEMEAGLPAGDLPHGKELFFGNKANCYACHTVGGQGGHVGPELSKIGAIRSRRDLLEAIVYPSASFARGFEPYVVSTNSGKAYPAGIIRGETADAITLVTGDRAEVRIPRADIESIVPGKVSIMPQGLDAQLSSQELSDVVTYLLGLK
jgi:putative membrane-bound dehydrogenase-like protein